MLPLSQAHQAELFGGLRAETLANREITRKLLPTEPHLELAGHSLVNSHPNCISCLLSLQPPLLPGAWQAPCQNQAQNPDQKRGTGCPSKPIAAATTVALSEVAEETKDTQTESLPRPRSQYIYSQGPWLLGSPSLSQEEKVAGGTKGGVH